MVWVCVCAYVRVCVWKCKGMVLYSAVSSPLDRSKRFTLSSPDRPVHTDTVLGFSWKHSSHAAIAQRLFTHISTTVYSQVLIYTAESTEASWRERKCPNFETVAKGIWTRALSIASPAFYHWATMLHCVHACMRVCVRVCVHACMRVYACVRACMWMRACECMRAGVHACMHAWWVCVQVCVKRLML